MIELKEEDGNGIRELLQEISNLKDTGCQEAKWWDLWQGIGNTKIKSMRDVRSLKNKLDPKLTEMADADWLTSPAHSFDGSLLASQTIYYIYSILVRLGCM